MYVIHARNVNDAAPMGITHLKLHGTCEDSRNGPVVESTTPVCTVYTHPKERVLFSPIRDANPFFHLMEALWMLNGEKGATWPTKFNSNMAKYVNGAGEYDGAYGDRWRNHFNVDQIAFVVADLTARPTSRRAVIAMYDPSVDINPDSLDVPCNTHMYFDLRGDRLNMVVCCRSNDAVWGAYGANAVHMSMLQEVIAAKVGVDVGEYRQISSNLHYYSEVESVQPFIADPFFPDLYRHGLMTFPLVSAPSGWDTDLASFMLHPDQLGPYANIFFYYVARPMYLAWVDHKRGDRKSALSWARQVEDEAWAHVAEAWLNRRYDK